MVYEIKGITMELPNADEEHLIPYGYWKIVFTETIRPHKILTAAFFFDQDGFTHDGYAYLKSLSIDQLEEITGYNFLRLLEDELEDELEANETIESADWLLNPGEVIIRSEGRYSDTVPVLDTVDEDVDVAPDEITVYVTPKGDLYHNAGCKKLGKVVTPRFLSEVEESYDACPKCWTWTP